MGNIFKKQDKKTPKNQSQSYDNVYLLQKQITNETETCDPFINIEKASLTQEFGGFKLTKRNPKEFPIEYLGNNKFVLSNKKDYEILLDDLLDWCEKFSNVTEKKYKNFLNSTKKVAQNDFTSESPDLSTGITTDNLKELVNSHTIISQSIMSGTKSHKKSIILENYCEMISYLTSDNKPSCEYSISMSKQQTNSRSNSNRHIDDVSNFVSENEIVPEKGLIQRDCSKSCNIVRLPDEISDQKKSKSVLVQDEISPLVDQDMLVKESYELQEESENLIISDNYGNMKQFSIKNIEDIIQYEKKSEIPVISVAITTKYLRKKKYLFTGDESGIIIQWDMETYSIYKNYGKVHTDSSSVDVLIISSQNKYQFSGCSSGIISKISIDDESIVESYVQSEKNSITVMRVTSNNKFLFSGTQNGTVLLLNTETLNIIKTINRNTNQCIYSQITTTNNQNAFIMDSSNYLQQWSLEDQNITNLGILHKSTIGKNIILATKDSNSLFCGDRNGYLKQIDINLKVVKEDFGLVLQGGIWAMSASPNNKFLFMGNIMGFLLQWSIEDQVVYKQFNREHISAISNIVCSSDSKYIYTADLNSNLLLWSLEESKVIKNYKKVHKGMIYNFNLN